MLLIGGGGEPALGRLRVRGRAEPQRELMPEACLGLRRAALRREPVPFQRFGEVLVHGRAVGEEARQRARSCFRGGFCRRGSARRRGVRRGRDPLDRIIRDIGGRIRLRRPLGRELAAQRRGGRRLDEINEPEPHLRAQVSLFRGAAIPVHGIGHALHHALGGFVQLAQPKFGRRVAFARKRAQGREGRLRPSALERRIGCREPVFGCPPPQRGEGLAEFLEHQSLSAGAASRASV